jgi:hypothetical protein
MNMRLRIRRYFVRLQGVENKRLSIGSKGKDPRNNYTEKALAELRYFPRKVARTFDELVDEMKKLDESYSGDLQWVRESTEVTMGRLAARSTSPPP